jgi:hypothetical protein
MVSEMPLRLLRDHPLHTLHFCGNYSLNTGFPRKRLQGVAWRRPYAGKQPANSVSQPVFTETLLFGMYSLADITYFRKWATGKVMRRKDNCVAGLCSGKPPTSLKTMK